MALVYLIHFETPLGSDNPRGKAQHYLGFTGKESLEKRMARHASGDGAAIMRAVKERGIDWQVARTWRDGSRALERRLKNYHKARQLCPLCRRKDHEPNA
jgi:predicted GIY-YIG superfamily endonuclease